MTDDLEKDIDATREHLAETVDALGAKLDVKTRTTDAVKQADNRTLAAIGAGIVLAVVGIVLLKRR